MQYQLLLTTADADAEAVADLLLEAGALAITYQDNQDCPQFEEHLGEVSLWPETKVCALFADGDDVKAVLAQLRTDLPELDLSSAEIESVAEKNWQEAWKEYFKPISFGERICVYPSWIEASHEKPCTLILDPGMAFGTGSHPTTRMMLQWLDDQELAGKDVIDYGCGSGILALAAAKLDAANVWGIDNDPNAVTMTLNNAKANGIPEERLQAWHNDDEPPLSADIVLANILANPLKSLAPHFAQITKAGGTLVISGLLAAQAPEVLAALEPWFKVAAEDCDNSDAGGDAWMRVVLERNA